MDVTIKLFGNLRRYLPTGQEIVKLALSDGATITTTIDQLGIDDGEVGLAVVNGEIAAETAALRDGDRLELFGIISGG